MNRDTRPLFLGGKYQSKVKGVSEVSQYIKGRLGTTTEPNPHTQDGPKDAPASYDVQSYYKAKLRMRNSIEKAFKS